jgi:hypothetical protein
VPYPPRHYYKTALFLRPPNGQRQKSSQKLYLSYLSAKGEGEEKKEGLTPLLDAPKSKRVKERRSLS